MNELEPQQTPQEEVAAPSAESAAAAAPEVPAAEAQPPASEPPAEPQPQAEEPATPAAAAAMEEAPKAEAAAKPAPAARPPRPARQQPQEKAQKRAAQEQRNEQRKTAASRQERRGPEGPVEIDLEKLIADSLYLDNQAHAVVARMRDMDSGTRSQLRRLFSAVRRACRTQEAERQHAFVMLRARLAYTIARHQLRSLDPLEKLLLQVTRKNDPRGYERFRDLFEAIVAYNE
ncbi:MAG: type III-A CRISPR-associated protein Csm2 [Bryobacteraceae bacterium]